MLELTSAVDDLYPSLSPRFNIDDGSLDGVYRANILNREYRPAAMLSDGTSLKRLAAPNSDGSLSNTLTGDG